MWIIEVKIMKKYILILSLVCVGFSAFARDTYSYGKSNYYHFLNVLNVINRNIDRIPGPVVSLDMGASWYAYLSDSKYVLPEKGVTCSFNAAYFDEKKSFLEHVFPPSSPVCKPISMSFFKPNIQMTKDDQKRALINLAAALQNEKVKSAFDSLIYKKRSTGYDSFKIIIMEASAQTGGSKYLLAENGYLNIHFEQEGGKMVPHFEVSDGMTMLSGVLQ